MGQPQHPRIRAVTLKSLLANKRPVVHSVGLDATVLEALNVMSEHDVGGVAVLDGKHVVGTFSERDFARMGDYDAELMRAKPVQQAMTPSIDFATPAQDAQSCLLLMTEKRLDFIPVLENGTLVGLLSIVELQKAIIAQYESIFQAYELDQRILFLQGTYSC